MFWLYEEELPAGVGGERFGTVHLVYIVCFLTLALGYALLYRRLDTKGRRTADRILGSAVLFFGLCEYGVTALLGHFSRYSLPLHVCSLMFFAVPLHAWTREGTLRGFLGAILFHPGIPGTLSALLFPDWLYFPFWNYMSVSSFLAHGFLLVYGASLLVQLSEARDPTGLFRRNLRFSALFMGLGALVMFLFDRAAGTNYWFMSGPSGDSPFLGIYTRGGYGGYLAAFALTALAVTALWYALCYVLFIRRRRKTE